jgi:hypothetical protein
MTTMLPHVTDAPWSSLPPEIREAPISCKWIGSDGMVWPLTGLDAGAEGAFVVGDIDGIVHVPFEGVWTSPAYGPPRFERTVDARREIAFQLGLYSDTTLGWYDTESRWWRGCKKDATGFFSVTTLRHGELWLPMQLLDTPKAPLIGQPSQQKTLLHTIILAVDGEPRWRRPPTEPPPFKRPPGPKDLGILQVANRGTEPAWPIYFLEAPLGGKSKVELPDGPNAIASDIINPLDDWPKLSELFGIPLVDEILGRFTRSRETNMIPIPDLNPGEHAIIDTDPSHRIAVTILDPVDNIIKKFIRNSELLDWISGHYGDSGLPLIQRFKGQGFSVPIPPRSVATLPVKHNRTGARISVQCPQLFESALAG